MRERVVNDECEVCGREVGESGDRVSVRMRESLRGRGRREGGDRAGVRVRERSGKERKAASEYEGEGERAEEGKAASSQGRAGCHV